MVGLLDSVPLYAPWMDRLRMVENCTHVGTFDGLSERRLVGLLDGVVLGITDGPQEDACDGFIDVSFNGVIEGRLLGLLDGAGILVLNFCRELNTSVV